MCFVLNSGNPVASFESICFKMLPYRPHRKLQIFEHFCPKITKKIDESSRRAQAGEMNVCSKLCEIFVAIESKVKEK